MFNVPSTAQHNFVLVQLIRFQRHIYWNFVV